ncbi:hypothetical protein [Ignavibacterium album]|uniref:hypothetical protein n=1 Tax=Ignavibacterium album TaxID=591197 RepID=UPI0038B2F1D5
MYSLIQAYPSGLFITDHDAMHRTVSKNKTINDFIGRTATFFCRNVVQQINQKSFYAPQTSGRGKRS